MPISESALMRASRVAARGMADRDTPFVFEEWYVAALSTEIGSTLLARTLLGRRVVLFRSASGAAVAFEDRCPHRSYPLSAGTLDGDTLICGYHGLRFDLSGKCVEIPSQSSCPAGISVRAYPVIELGPLIWIWMGDPKNADEARIPPTPWLTDAGWVSSQGYFHLRGNYISLHENLLDLTHLSFIHARSFGTPDYVRAAYETELGDGHFAVKRRVVPTRLPPVWAKPTGLEHDQSARITTSEFVSPGLHVVTARFFDTRLAPDARPEFAIRTCHMPTPETHGSTHYFIVHSRDFALDQPDVTQFMHDQLFTAFAEDVVALERLELTLAAAQEDHFEISIESDKATVAMRRYIKGRVGTE